MIQEIPEATEIKEFDTTDESFCFLSNSQNNQFSNKFIFLIF